MKAKDIKKILYSGVPVLDAMPWHADSWLAASHPWEGGYWSAEPRQQFNLRVRGQSGVIY